MSDSPTFDRRNLLKLGAAAAAGVAVGRLEGATEALPSAPPALPKGPQPQRPWNPVTPTAMPMRNLGKTGHRVGLFSLGGQAAIEQPNNEAVAVPILERAIELGVNYIDTAAAYGRPERWSETYIGKVMKRHRDKVFLASKTHDRTSDGSMRNLEQSLKLLNTDHLDAWQVHNLMTIEQLDQITGKGGALEALLKARDQKLVRFLGVTGHYEPKVLMEALRRFPFDTLLLSLNAADPHHLSFKQELLPYAVEREIGLIGMKIPSRGRLIAGWNPPPADQQRGPIKATRTGTLNIKEAMRYVLTLPVSTVILGVDSIAQLEEDVAIARDFQPLTATQMAALEQRAEPVAQQALWYRKW